MRKALMMLGLVSLLGFAGCNMDLYTSEFKDQQVTTVDESLDNGFDGSNPVFLSATKGAYTDRISLSWTKVTGADYYVVERAPEGSDEYQELPETVMGTSYDDVADTTNPIVAGRRYSYRVYARSYAKKAESGSQATARAVGSILTVPESVAADKGKNSDYIMVSWSPVVDATAYKVYVKGTNSASYTLAGTASGSQTRFRYLVGENEQGQELYFKVSSVGSNNAVTGLDDGTYAIGFSLVAGAPSSPTNLVASQGKALVYSTSKNQMQLTWDKADSGTTGYQIYRSAPGENEEQIYPYGSSDDTLDMSGTETGVITLSNDCGESVVMTLNVYKHTFTMDRTESGDCSFSADFTGATTTPLFVKQDSYHVILFLDHCSIEAFDANGYWAMTNLVFPSEPYNRLAVNGGKAKVYPLK